MVTIQECNILNSVHDDFYGMGVSPVDASKGIISGRPYGGVGILWRKNIDIAINVIDFKCDWMCGIEIVCDDRTFYLLNVYLPYQSDENLDRFNDCLGKLHVQTQEISNTCITVVGDFNSNIMSSTVFGDLLLKFCEENNYILADKVKLPADTYTYLSPAWGTTSWLDHILCTADAMLSIHSVSVLHDCILSDHFPLSFKYNVNLVPERSGVGNNEIKPRINWSKLTMNCIEQYTCRCTTSAKFGDITVGNGIKCLNPNCCEVSHLADIDNFYNNIKDVLLSSSEILLQSNQRNSNHNVPGWNDDVEPYHSAARDAYVMWRNVGKPRNGPIFDIMRRSRSKFKSVLRKCKRNKDIILADKLADSFRTKNDRDFWKDIKRQLNSKVNLPNQVDNCKGDDIPCMWKAHYDFVFNSVGNSNCSNFLKNIGDMDFDNNMIVSAGEICDIIKKLTNGKASGKDGLTSEHIQYAGMNVSKKIFIVVLFIYVSSWIYA